MFANELRAFAALFVLVCCAACSDAPWVDPAAPSRREALRFKRADRLINDFARALALDPSELPASLDRVALGGTDAYDANVYRPAETPGITASLVVDHLALSACALRVDRDLLDPASALIYAGDQPTAVDRLYKRALQRAPAKSEVDALIRLSTRAEDPRSWSILSCFAVLSSEESLFY